MLGKTAGGIFSSNAFTIHEGDAFLPVDDGVLRAAVFQTSARLNHSCRPNCYVAWDPRRGVHTVHAIRHISPGDEMTIAYLAAVVSTGTRTQRVAELEAEVDEPTSPHHSKTVRRAILWPPCALRLLTTRAYLSTDLERCLPQRGPHVAGVQGEAAKGAGVHGVNV